MISRAIAWTYMCVVCFVWFSMAVYIFRPIQDIYRELGPGPAFRCLVSLLISLVSLKTG